MADLVAENLRNFVGATPDEPRVNVESKNNVQRQKLNESVIHEKSMALLSVKLVAPPIEVGPNNVGLMGAPNLPKDTVSSPGCKTYSQLSYACLSRSYMVALCSMPPLTKERIPTVSTLKSRYTNKGPLNGLTFLEQQGLGAGYYLWDTIDNKLVLSSTVKNPEIVSTINAVEAPRSEEYIIKGSSFVHANLIPVNMISVNQAQAPMISNQIPFSPEYLAMREKLSTTHAQGDLNNIVRAPMIRDGALLLSLAKWLNSTTNTANEQAAMLRLICMGLSLEPDLYEVDPVVAQFVRRVKTSESEGIDIRTYGVDREYYVTAVPLDTALAMALNKVDVVPGWEYDKLDVTWTMVPVRSKMLGKWMIVPYIASFMHSQLWSGSVNWTHKCTWLGDDWLPYREGFVATMPKINSTHIPGPKRVMMVLMDCNSRNAPRSVSLGTVYVPILDLSGTNPIDFVTHIWHSYYTTAHLNEVRFNIADALHVMLNEMTTDPVPGSILSLASELYGRWGFGLHSHPKAEEKYLSEALSGAWAWAKGQRDTYPNSLDKKNGSVLANPYEPVESDGTSTTVHDDPIRDSMLTAFNFCSHSPMHRLPSGGIECASNYNTKTIDVNGTKWNVIGNPTTFWEGLDPMGSLAYNVTTCSSLMRLCIGVGLVQTSNSRYNFPSTAGLGTWIHMNSVALSGDSALFLLKNDIDLKSWLGFVPDFLVSTNLSAIYSSLVRDLTHRMYNWYQPQQLTSGRHTWRWENIYTFYLRMPESTYDFLRYSGVPSTFVLQWNKKCMMDDNVAPKEDVEIVITDAARTFWGNPIVHGNGVSKIIYTATTDALRYMPKLYIKPLGARNQIMGMNFECWGRLSTATDHLPTDNQYLQSNTLMYCSKYPQAVCAGTNDMWSTGSLASLRGADAYSHITDILYPNSDNADNFLQKALGYLAGPLLAGLRAYTTKDPLAAVTTASGKIAEMAGQELQN